MKELFYTVYKVCKMQMLMQLFLRVSCGLLPIFATLIWNQIITSAQSGLELFSVQNLFFALTIIGGISVSYPFFIEIADTLLRNGVSVNLQKMVHQKAENLPYIVYESPHLDDAITNASKVFCYGDAIGLIVQAFSLVQNTIAVVSIAFTVGFFNKWLSLIAFLLLLPGSLRLWLNNKHIKLEVELRPKEREANVLKSYLLSRNSAKEIRVLDTGDFFIKEWEKSISFIIEKTSELNLKSLLANLATEFFEHIVILLAYWFCLNLVFSGELPIASFGALIILIGQYLKSLSDLTKTINFIYKDAATISSAIDYFRILPEKRDEVLISAPITVNFENVSFAYPDTASKALESISVTLKRGEILAVIGLNGAGKTTFSKLLLGLLDPTEGKVTYDGFSPTMFSYDTLYNHSSALFQDFLRYAMSVKENITLTNHLEASDEKQTYEMISSLGIDFISDGLDLNLQTELGVEFGGRDLSGGEWQQLALARSAYRSSGLIVLDEPTSAIDPLKESEMYKVFQNLCENKIGVIITHRLGMCLFADKILVLSEGRVAEYGTHEELLSKEGSYASIYKSQRELYV